jgi:hypothetical protein
MDGERKPIEVRFELFGNYPGDRANSAAGKHAKYLFLPRKGDFVYYDVEWYEVIGVYMYPCEGYGSDSSSFVTLKVKYSGSD